MSDKRTIWIGYDPRETLAFALARLSCRSHLTQPIPIQGLILADLVKAGLYKRKIEMRPSAADRPVMWDVVSDAPMSTEHANSRFFVPHLAKHGWALFTDGDVLFRGNVVRLFEQLDNSKAVYCVKHDHTPAGTTKMDGQVQTKYSRKNWSSVMAINCDHPSNKRGLSLQALNTTPGRFLHAFCWLEDDEIGELDPAWNHLVGYSDPAMSATIAHFTSGVPDMPGYEKQRYADEWFLLRDSWIRGNVQWDLETKSLDQDWLWAQPFEAKESPSATVKELSGTATLIQSIEEIPTSPLPATSLPVILSGSSTMPASDATAGSSISPADDADGSLLPAS